MQSEQAVDFPDTQNYYPSEKPLRKPACLRVTNPYDESLIETVPYSGMIEIQDAIDAASRYNASLNAWQRYDVLNKVARLLNRQHKFFMHLISQESGKTLKDSGIEVERAIPAFLLSAEQAKRISGDAIPLDSVKGQEAGYAYVVREPVGPVAAITPFNFPLNLVAHKLGPALAANNPVLLKPSEKTPLTAIRLAELFYQAGLPEEMLHVLIGDPAKLVATLATDPRVKMVSFTGSVEIGKSICAMAGMKHVSMELGGNDPMILLEDIDVDAVIPIAIDGAFGTNGQRCTSVKRLIIHEAIADDFIQKFVQATSKLKTGNQLDPTTDIGPLIDTAAAITIEKRIWKAVRHAGASLLYGGRRIGATIEPTVLDHVSMCNPIVQQETFGPVAPFIRIGSIDQAIEIANQSQYGLQAGVFTNNLSYAKKAIAGIRAGGVFINKPPCFRAEHLPFGGVKDSGIGREGIFTAVKAMTTQKTVVI